MFDIGRALQDMIADYLNGQPEPVALGPMFVGTPCGNCQGGCKNTCRGGCAGSCHGTCTRSCQGRSR